MYIQRSQMHTEFKAPKKGADEVTTLNFQTKFWEIGKIKLVGANLYTI